LLVVDDNQTNRRILTRLALRWGMLPSTLPSGLEALDRIRHGEVFDLAVLDFSMPAMNGLELAAQIRSVRSADELPIVMLTSFEQRPALQGDAGAVLAAYLSKPIKASELFATLTAVVQGRGVVPAAAPALPQPMDSLLATRQPLRVLIAEDHPINQRVAVQLLKRLGYRADVAGNGLEAIEAVERQAYDVVLMDVQMPDMDGLQATRWIVQRRSADGLPRIVAMTANAMPGDREAYLAAGMDGYVAKPIEIGALTEVLTQASRWAGATRAKPMGADAVIDAQRLEHLRDLQDAASPRLVRELIDMFIADAPGQLKALTQAARNADAPQLVSLAHRLLSATDNIGVRHMSVLCTDIERLARAGLVDEAARRVELLPSEYERACAALLELRPRY
jgi:CheY-like chemotaxis protein